MSLLILASLPASASDSSRRHEDGSQRTLSRFIYTSTDAKPTALLCEMRVSGVMRRPSALDLPKAWCSMVWSRWFRSGRALDVRPGVQITWNVRSLWLAVSGNEQHNRGPLGGAGGRAWASLGEEQTLSRRLSARGARCWHHSHLAARHELTESYTQVHVNR
jgi:hypothetical protein